MVREVSLVIVVGIGTGTITVVLVSTEVDKVDLVRDWDITTVVMTLMTPMIVISLLNTEFGLSTYSQLQRKHSSVYSNPLPDFAGMQY